MRGRSLFPTTKNRVLPRFGFERALELPALKSTVPLQHLQGPVVKPKSRRSDC